MVQMLMYDPSNEGGWKDLASARPTAVVKTMVDYDCGTYRYC
jgi:hypothetical protein